MVYQILGVAGQNYNTLSPEEQAQIQQAGTNFYEQQKATVQSTWDPAYQQEYLTNAEKSAQEKAQRYAEALFTSKSNAIQTAEEQKATLMNAFIASNPNASSLPTNIDPKGEYAVVNGVLTQKSAIAQNEQYKAGVANGTLREVNVNGATAYVPVGSSADTLQKGLATGAVSPTDPNAQYQASLAGNTDGQVGINPQAPVQNQPQQTQTTTPQQTPIQNLQLGSTGDSVKQLQTMLGITADGIFGPKTLEAVKAYQQSHGLVVDGIVGPKTMSSLGMLNSASSTMSSVGAGIQSNNAGNVQNNANLGSTGGATGTTTQTTDTTQPKSKSGLTYTGNPEIDSAIDLLDNQSPQTSFSQIYKQIYNDLGLVNIKTDYEKYTKEYTDLQNEKTDKMVEINANPWYSEGRRVAELRKLDAKYEGRENNLTNKIKLAENMYENGRQDAQFIAGQTMGQLNQTSNLNQDLILKAIDIAEANAKAEKLLEVSPGASLYDPKSGKFVGTAPKTNNTKSTTTSKPSIKDAIAGITQTFKTGISPAGDKIGNGMGADGFTDPYVYITAFENWPGTTTEFLSKFPVNRYVNPLSYTILPASIRPNTKQSSSDENLF